MHVYNLLPQQSIDFQEFFSWFTSATVEGARVSQVALEQAQDNAMKRTTYMHTERLLMYRQS